MVGVPSLLGFVCKPDMPPHINILFRARPTLEYIPLPKKSSIKNYTGIFDSNSNKNLLDLFEKTPPPKPQEEFSKYKLKLKTMVERIEKNKLINKEKFKECKYLFIIHWYRVINFFCFFSNVLFLFKLVSFSFKTHEKQIFACLFLNKKIHVQ
jgi:hypothetical protein